MSSRTSLIAACFAVAILGVAIQARLHSTEIPCDKPCAADPAWFPKTPKPGFQKPDPDSDCEFYRPAWQYLLYVMQEQTPGTPRLFEMDHPEDLFGRPLHTRFPKAPKGALRLAPRVALSGDPLAGAEINQAGSTGVLVDSSTGCAVYYSVHLNDTYSKFIRDNRYDDVLNLKNAPPDQEFPRGTAEFKASWRILPDNDPGDGFVTWTATLSKLAIKNGQVVIDPNSSEPNKRVALLGIHVVFVLDGHPEFIWATFEHNNNAPELNKMEVDEPGPDKFAGAPVDGNPVDNTPNWTLYAQGTAANKCNLNNKGHLVLDVGAQTLSPRTSVFRQFHFGNDEDPCVIETLNQSVYDGIDAALPKIMEGDAKKRLKALKNYSLRGAMWLNNPAYFREAVNFSLQHELHPDSKILGGDPALSNASIKTFTQPWRGHSPEMPHNPTSRNSSFCFDCHTTLLQQKRLPNNMTVELPALRLNVSQTLVQRYFEKATPPMTGNP